MAVVVVADKRFPNANFKKADAETVDVVLHRVVLVWLQPLTARVLVQVLPGRVADSQGLAVCHTECLEPNKKGRAKSRDIVFERQDCFWPNVLVNEPVGMQETHRVGELLRHAKSIAEGMVQIVGHQLTAEASRFVHPLWNSEHKIERHGLSRRTVHHSNDSEALEEAECQRVCVAKLSGESADVFGHRRDVAVPVTPDRIQDDRGPGTRSLGHEGRRKRDVAPLSRSEPIVIREKYIDFDLWVVFQAVAKMMGQR